MRMLFRKGTYGHILIYRICNLHTDWLWPPPYHH